MVPDVHYSAERVANAESMKSVSWKDVTWIAFDTETSGKYPIESEICEIAAVKWQGGKEIGSFQSLVKPSRPMSQEVIRIHGITNEMVKDAPEIGPVLKGFADFISGGVLLAHHAQFDLGFVAAQMDQQGLALPPELTVCTSLLAQGNVPETPNHRLQTLVAHYGINPGQAHRALDDARACLLVALKIFEKFPESMTVEELAKRMLRRSQADLGPLRFSRFSIDDLVAQHPHIRKFFDSIPNRQIVEMVYKGGSRPSQPRNVVPVGVIRQLDGDTLVASEIGDLTQVKRYWVKDVTSIA